MFAAWRTYFERITGHGTVALLFEDLHWADSGMLDFIDHMLDWSLNVPILIVTLSRPELLDNRPGWGAGRRNFLALDLQPLDDAGMRELLGGLVSGLPEQAIRSIVTRAEGIPLYAVETIRMLVADGRLVARDDGRFEPAGELGDLAIPETLHALIAARLDALAPEDRMLVQDAAVLGQSFTTAALSAVSGLEADALEPRLGALVRADLFHREVDPRSPERGQYAFVQAVIREVAYSTLALRDRRGRHLAAARYFESLGDDELAGALAAHYLAAFRSAPEGPEAEALASQARIALRAAADRAIALGSPLQAVKYLEQAIEVTDSDEDRAAMLEQAGEAASNGARTDLALPLLEQAQEVRERLGDERAVARVIGLRARALYTGRKHDESIALLRPAVERFAAMSDDPVGISLSAALAANLIRLGQYAEGLPLLDQVLSAAERYGAADIAAEAMIGKGLAYGFHGRMWEARALHGGARQLAEEISRPDIVASANHNLSFEVALDDPRLAVQLQREVIDLARQLGRRTMEITTLGNMSEDARRTGDWDWVFDEINAVMSLHPEGNDTIPLRLARQSLSAYRGEVDGEEMANLARALEVISDPDISIGYQDIQASSCIRGRPVGGGGRDLVEGRGDERPQPAVRSAAGGSRVCPGRRRRRRRGNPRAVACPWHARTGRRCRPGLNRGGHRRVAWRFGRGAGRVPHGNGCVAQPRSAVGRGPHHPRGGHGPRHVRSGGRRLGRWRAGDVRAPAGCAAGGPPRRSGRGHSPAACPHRNDGGVAGLVPGRQLAGGAVLSRTTSSVASSTRVCFGVSPRAIATTIPAAAVAMSMSGWRTVVIGGPTHCATGRSSKPTTLRSSGMWRRASRAAW